MTIGWSNQPRRPAPPAGSNVEWLHTPRGKASAASDLPRCSAGEPQDQPKSQLERRGGDSTDLSTNPTAPAESTTGIAHLGRPREVRPPKVLIASATPSTIDRFNRSNLRILREIGCEPHVATCFGEFDHWSNPGFREELELDGVVTHHIGFFRGARPARAWGITRAFRALLSREQFDLVHLQTPTAAAIGRIAMAGMKQRRPRVMYTAHGFHFFRGGPLVNWLYYPLEAALARNTDLILVMNREDACRALRFSGPSVELVPGVGVDPIQFRPPTPSERLAFRRREGIHDDEFLIVTIGELNRNKNQQLLLKAVARLPEGRDFRVLLVGDGTERESLTKLARDLGLQDRASLLGYRRDIADLLRAADVLVSTSIREGLPVNVIEAMMCGLASVVTDTRGNRDLIEDGRTGLIVKLNDADSLAVALDRLRLETALPRQLGGVAREIASMSYGNATVDCKMRELYLKILEI